MGNVKAVIFDYDGTLLLANQSRISKEIVVLLKTLKKRNIVIVLATGRPLNHCSYLLEENLVDYIVSANGSLVSTKYTNLQSLNINKENINTFKKFCIKNKLPASFYTDSLLVNGIVDHNIEVGLREAMNIDVHKLKNLDEKDEQNVCLMCAFCNSDIDQKLQKHFPDMFLLRWHPNIVSFLEYEVMKTTGILKALEHSNISQLECIAVGDGENDIDMLKMAKYGVAIGCNQNLMQIADMTIDSVSQDFMRVLDEMCGK